MPKVIACQYAKNGVQTSEKVLFESESYDECSEWYDAHMFDEEWADYSMEIELEMED